MKYNIITIGCQMNWADSERIASYLEDYGLSATTEHKSADVVVLTTCGVRQSAEDRVYGLVHEINKANKSAIVIVTGCLSRRPDVKRRLEGKVSIWLPISELQTLGARLFKLLNKDVLRSKPEHFKKASDYLKIAAKYKSSFSALIPIGNGCNNFCSYCVVPYARGREVYRRAEDIVKEAKSLVKQGYKEIILIAQNVNSYRSGYDSNVEFDSAKKPAKKIIKSAIDFPELLCRINAIKGDFWIRFVSSNPKDMSQKLIKVLGTCEKVCEHVHFAVQSGDDEIIKAMNRYYTAAHYLKLVEDIRRSFKKHKTGLPAAISTDLIVGFPGETKKQFLNSKKLFKLAVFDMAYTAQYSPRFGTASNKLEDNVSHLEKKRREDELNNVLRKTALAKNLWYKDKLVEVLVEGKNRRGAWHGKTRTYKTVRFSSDNKEDLTGKIVPVRIVSVRDFELSGNLELK